MQRDIIAYIESRKIGINRRDEGDLYFENEVITQMQEVAFLIFFFFNRRYPH